MESRQYGLTPPISEALPTDSEKRSNDALYQELRNQGTFEPPADTAKRERVLQSLEKVVDAFVKKVAQEKHPNNAAMIRDAHGRVFVYGSYRLGVYGPGSDMDTLVVVPKYVNVEDYFAYFPDLLVKMAGTDAITDLTPVPDAFVPIIKFEFYDVSIDLIFCSMKSVGEIPREKSWSLKDDNLLRGLDDTQVRSLNGTRVTDAILSLIPEQATFRLALRAIKLWAQRRAIYANIMGYPGGVAWAMLVARVCQLYPKATSAVIVNKFFHIIRRWPWPQPVLLKNVEDGMLGLRVWNPQIYPGDRHHKMPIITPAYPSMCATHNIGRSSMAVIQQELEIGGKLTDEIMIGKRPWRDLFAKHSFFTSGFKYYLTVTTASTAKDSQKLWSGLVESKVRLLVQKLEFHPSIQLARPFNKGYDRVHLCKNDEEIRLVQEGSQQFVIKDDELAKFKAAEVNGNGSTSTNGQADAKVEDGDSENNTKTAEGGEGQQQVSTLVYTTNHYIGLQLVEKAKSLDLSYQVNEFKGLCTGNETIYDDKTMCLSIQHLRNFSLPDDVFDAGEVKPTKPVKKNAKNGNAASNGTGPPNNANKRVATEENSIPAKRQQTSAAPV